ncbi:MAG: DUF4870 domain-containing protein [Anaerolineae bacterium]
MSSEPFSPNPVSSEPSSNARLMAALSYPLFPIVSIIVLLMEDHKNNPFERYHAIQALGAGVGVWVAVMVLSLIFSVTVILACLAPVLWLVAFVPFLWWGYQAYQGKMFDVPVVTDLMKKQNWL